MASIALDILLFLYAVAAPGAAITHVALPNRPLFERAAAGLTIGLFAVPLLHFVVAIALSTHVSRGLVAANATGVLLLCWLVALKRR
jgi:hypothetical protein